MFPSNHYGSSHISHLKARGSFWSRKCHLGYEKICHFLRYKSHTTSQWNRLESTRSTWHVPLVFGRARLFSVLNLHIPAPGAVLVQSAVSPPSAVAPKIVAHQNMDTHSTDSLRTSMTHCALRHPVLTANPNAAGCRPNFQVHMRRSGRQGSIQMWARVVVSVWKQIMTASVHGDRVLAGMIGFESPSESDKHLTKFSQNNVYLRAVFNFRGTLKWVHKRFQNF